MVLSRRRAGDLSPGNLILLDRPGICRVLGRLSEDGTLPVEGPIELEAPVDLPVRRFRLRLGASELVNMVETSAE
jgi:hypothetical protein